MPLKRVHCTNFTATNVGWAAVVKDAGGNAIYQLIERITDPNDPSNVVGRIMCNSNGNNGGFWLDDNHSGEGGAGYLSLMCVANTSSQGGVLGVLPASPINLVGGKFKIRAKANNLRIGKDTQINFWFQTWDSIVAKGQGRHVNYHYIGESLDEKLGFPPCNARTGAVTVTSGWVDFEVPLTKDDAYWLPLGSSAGDAFKYGKSERVEIPLSNWAQGMGIHAFYGSALPQAIDYPWGQLLIDNIELWVDADLNPNTAEV